MEQSKVPYWVPGVGKLSARTRQQQQLGPAFSCHQQPHASSFLAPTLLFCFPCPPRPSQVSTPLLVQSLAQLDIPTFTQSAPHSLKALSVPVLWPQHQRCESPPYARKPVRIISFHLPLNPTKEVLSSSSCRWESTGPIQCAGHTISERMYALENLTPKPICFFSPIRIMAQFTKTQPGTLCFYPLFLFIVNKTPKVMTADRSMINKKCDALILRKVSVLSISSKCLRQSCEMSKKQVRIVC